jgi:hypothetical protein
MQNFAQEGIPPLLGPSYLGRRNHPAATAIFGIGLFFEEQRHASPDRSPIRQWTDRLRVVFLFGRSGINPQRGHQA